MKYPYQSSPDAHARTGGALDPPRRSASQLKIDTSFDIMNQGLPTTPNGDMARVYKFYCPLCCMYFQTLFKTSCCANYACKPCALSFVKCMVILDF